MNPEGWIALGAFVVAIYAACVSTWLAYQEQAKLLKMYIKFISFEERYQLILNNTGKRPITIWSISATPSDGFDPIPPGAMFRDINLKIPIVLEPYGSLVLPISYPIEGEEDFPKITVYDIDGKVYTNYLRRKTDAKWGDMGT